MNEEQFVSEMFDTVMDFRHSLRKETDRGCALMAGEFLSNELAALLKRRFVHDAKACDAVLEDANGPLASFSSRIEFAYLLGLIGPDARRELHLVRRIRNDFAHDYKPLDFSAEGIANRCRELRAHTLVPDERPRANFTRSVMGLLAAVHGSMLYAKHAEPEEDILSKFSQTEIEAAGEKTKALADEFMKMLGLRDQNDDKQN